MAISLTDVSQALAAVVEAAGKSVVRVDARRGIPATGFVWSAEGVIVTAHHVVMRPDDITVGLPDGQAVAGTLVGRDPSTDLAVLRVEASGLAPITLASFDRLGVGHVVLALGRPGRTVMATLGIVSALGQSWRTPAGGELDRYLQTDVVMYPGFSGGPLVDASGQVLGLNTSALLRGVSLAVPAPSLDSLVHTILAHGHVHRGYLGIGAQPARLPDALAAQVGQETGLLVISVEPGSPAERGGLLMGDTLVTVDSEAVRHLDDLLALLSGDRVGKTVTVRLVRAGALAEQQVTIGEHD
jgi:S1-C subfamily serine protease